MSEIILTTGGTGGHIFPALAVAEALKQLEPGISLLFVGSLWGPEARLCAQANVPFFGLRVRGLLGRGFRAFAAGALMLKAVVSAVGLLRREKPRVVAGFGGYASFAPMAASLILGIPQLLHEQNALAGTSNRLMGRFVRRIATSLPETEGFAREKCVFCGNPVRQAVVDASRQQRRFDRKHLLVFGGSQGAHALNTFMLSHLEAFRQAHVEIIHQTGERDFAEVSSAYAAQGFPKDSVRAFIDDMPAIYQWADLALCRSGASTVAELCASRLPSVLVPFPYAIHDHQSQNARVLEAAGAARLLPETALAEQGLPLLQDLLSAPEQLQVMAERAQALARPEAALNVAKLILELRS
ncbi:MAG: undecaprenyldiphospho-muramoylpentapeptide beta-N-acetylglucosaminyltransferase [Desulfovibrio sp.]|nr:undecaprenyldiphospho-muramoylpentapeptide beta-N-acetylglucosaminyltransferase [Desulfovibrio sp.]